MKITFPAGPAGAADCISGFLQGVVDRDVFARLPDRIDFDPVNARISPAFKVYHLDQEGLQEVQELAGARPGVWQYLVFSNNSPVTDVGVTEQDGRLVVSHMTCESLLARATVEVLQMAEAAEDGDGTGHEFRLLRSPCVRFIGVWLHSSDHDVVIPIARSSTPGLAVKKFYTGSQTVDLLKAHHRTIWPKTTSV